MQVAAKKTSKPGLCDQSRSAMCSTPTDDASWILHHVHDFHRYLACQSYIVEVNASPTVDVIHKSLADRNQSLWSKTWVSWWTRLTVQPYPDHIGISGAASNQGGREHCQRFKGWASKCSHKAPGHYTEGKIRHNHCTVQQTLCAIWPESNSIVESQKHNSFSFFKAKTVTEVIHTMGTLLAVQANILRMSPKHTRCQMACTPCATYKIMQHTTQLTTGPQRHLKCGPCSARA